MVHFYIHRGGGLAPADLRELKAYKGLFANFIVHQTMIFLRATRPIYKKTASRYASGQSGSGCGTLLLLLPLPLPHPCSKHLTKVIQDCKRDDLHKTTFRTINFVL